MTMKNSNKKRYRFWTLFSEHLCVWSFLGVSSWTKLLLVMIFANFAWFSLIAIDSKVGECTNGVYNYFGTRSYGRRWCWRMEWINWYAHQIMNIIHTHTRIMLIATIFLHCIPPISFFFEKAYDNNNNNKKQNKLYIILSSAIYMISAIKL